VVVALLVGSIAVTKSVLPGVLALPLTSTACTTYPVDAVSVWTAGTGVAGWLSEIRPAAPAPVQEEPVDFAIHATSEPT
jgi:hypothetical protein